MVYQLIENLKFDELKYILRLRGLRVSRKKSELVVRAFVAKKQQLEELADFSQLYYCQISFLRLFNSDNIIFH